MYVTCCKNITIKRPHHFTRLPLSMTSTGCILLYRKKKEGELYPNLSPRSAQTRPGCFGYQPLSLVMILVSTIETSRSWSAWLTGSHLWNQLISSISPSHVAKVGMFEQGSSRFRGKTSRASATSLTRRSPGTEPGTRGRASSGGSAGTLLSS